MTEYLKKKIALCGGGGTGKSYLCNAYSKAVQTAYIPATTRAIAAEFGFASHAEVVKTGVMDPEKGIAYQTECSRRMAEVFKSTPEKHFITDRSPLDFMAYYLLQNSFWATKEQTDNVIAITKDACKVFDVIILLPVNAFKVVGDGYRTTNEITHEIVEDMIRFSARKADVQLVEMPRSIVDINERINFVQSTLRTNASRPLSKGMVERS